MRSGSSPSSTTLKIIHGTVPFDTRGDGDIVDATLEIQRVVQKSGVGDGIAVATVAGSTAAITTMEFEPGLMEDFKTAMERLVPKTTSYRHDAAWGDGNGYAHVRASMIGASITLPIVKGKLVLGTWQQIVLIDFDNRPRHRDIVVQIIGS